MDLSGYDLNEAFLLGDKRRREVLGDAHVDKSYDNVSEFSLPWRQYANEVGWGRAWNFPGLDLKTRSMCTIAAMTALGAYGELRIHIRGALNLEVTPEELRAIFVQVSAYAGVSKGAEAMRIAEKVMNDEA